MSTFKKELKNLYKIINLSIFVLLKYARVYFSYVSDVTTFGTILLNEQNNLTLKMMYLPIVIKFEVVEKCSFLVKVFFSLLPG